jgi:hypothetical protein
MLDEAEFSIVVSKRGAAGEGNSGSGQYGAALAEYERITGYRETNFAAIWHHRLALYGPPCKSCGNEFSASLLARHRLKGAEGRVLNPSSKIVC